MFFAADREAILPVADATGFPKCGAFPCLVSAVALQALKALPPNASCSFLWYSLPFPHVLAVLHFAWPQFLQPYRIVLPFGGQVFFSGHFLP